MIPHSILKTITTNSNTLNSLWDDPTFAWYKKMHDTYGAVFSFYCFYSYNGFNLSQVTDKFKNEFEEAASWLKFGFHAKDSGSNYNNLDAETCIADYIQIQNEIIRFAGYNSIDHIPRFHYFAAKREAITELGLNYGLLGALAADDTRNPNSGLTDSEIALINSCDDYFDRERNLYFCKTEYRMDNDTSSSVLTKLNTLSDSKSNNDIYIMFLHEPRTLTQEGKDTIESCLKWAVDKNISFKFPQTGLSKY